MNAKAGAVLKPGDVIQIDPLHDPMFGGAFLIVTEVKSWGVKGYVPMGIYREDAIAHEKLPDKELTEPSSPLSVAAFYRVGFEHIELIGESVWAIERGEEEAEEVNDADPLR